MEALGGLQKVYSITWNSVLCQERSIAPSMYPVKTSQFL